MLPKYRKLDYNKNKKAQKNTHMLAIFVDHGIINNCLPKWRWLAVVIYISNASHLHFGE